MGGNAKGGFGTLVAICVRRVAMVGLSEPGLLMMPIASGKRGLPKGILLLLRTTLLVDSRALANSQLITMPGAAQLV
jgi:hypothetical protein